MKKYYIRDENGSLHYMKAKNLEDAMLKLTSSVKDSVKDAVSLKKGDWFINNYEARYNDLLKLYKVVDDKLQERNGFSASMLVEEYLFDVWDTGGWREPKHEPKLKKKGTTTIRGRDLGNITVFNSVDEAMKWLNRRVQISKDLKNRRDSLNSIKDDVVSNYFYFDLDDLSMSLDNAVNIMKNCGLTIVKIDKRNKEAKVYYRGASAAEQKAADKLDISLDDSINDTKTKDEANLPTTIQALVNDEEAAIKSYEVAIKNLEGKIDETQMQVLINIMKDERRHVENLYAILNGQVTEKNLEDSASQNGK